MIAVWGRENSTNVKKVLWCLEELELPYTMIPTGGKYGGNHSREYLEMNPNGLVPCLRDDESSPVLWESNAIVRYLTAQYGQSRLWIETPSLRGQAEKWMDWSSTTLSPAHRTVLMGVVRTPPEQRNPQEIERGIAECTPLLSLLDNALRDAQWFSGSEFGVGDIALAPYIWNFYHCGIDWPTLERLEDWHTRLSERPAYRKIVMIPVT